MKRLTTRYDNLFEISFPIRWTTCLGHPLLGMVFERSEIVELIAGQKCAFWALLFGIGFVKVMAWTASAGVGNARWQVNVVQSVLYVVSIGLAGYSFFKRQAACITDK